MELSERTQALSERMARQMRLKGADLSTVVERAGRKLPKRLRADVDYLIEAEALASHPKLGRQIDMRRVDKAERRISAYLNGLNPRAERIGEVLDRIAGIAFVLVVVGLSVFFFLLWQGYFDRTP